MQVTQLGNLGRGGRGRGEEGGGKGEEGGGKREGGRGRREGGGGKGEGGEGGIIIKPLQYVPLFFSHKTTLLFSL